MILIFININFSAYLNTFLLAILVQKLGEKKMSKYISGYFKTKNKNPTAINLDGGRGGGGGKASMTLPLRK